MIGLLLGKFGLEAGLKLSRGAIIGLVVAGLVAAGGFGFWRGVAAIERMVFAARAAAIAERDKHWEAQIATSNAAAEKARADQAIAAARASAEAESRITDLTKMLAEWEARNAATPDAACLDAGDVDDLNRLRRPGAAGTNGANRAR